MPVRVRIEDILWTTLRAIDASKDERRSTLPVTKLKREMLRTIALLNAAKLEVIVSRRRAEEPNDAA